MNKLIQLISAAFLLSVLVVSEAYGAGTGITKPSELISSEAPLDAESRLEDRGTDSGAAKITAVHYGCSDNARSGRYNPVSIEAENRSDGDFTGQLCITAGEGEGQNRYIHGISIPVGQTGTFSCYIPLSSTADIISVSLMDESRQVLDTRQVQLGTDRNDAGLFTGILSDSPQKLDYLDDVALNYGLVRTRNFSLKADNFPSDSKGLDIFDVIVVSDYSIRNLNEGQTRALMDWVRAGGVLMLGTGERADDTLGRFAPELLDDMYEDPEKVKVDFGSDFATSSPGDAVIELSVIGASLHGGNTVIQGEDGPIVTTVNKGSGLIAVAAFDFNDLGEFAASRPAFARTLFERILGPGRILKLTGQNYGGGNDRTERIYDMMQTKADRLPPVSIYAFSVLAYILLVGPGLYVFLKQREMSRLYRPGVALLSVFFAVIIFLIGSRTRYKGTFFDYVMIREAGEDSITEISFINISDPGRHSYSALIEPGYSVYPVEGQTADKTGEGSLSIGYYDEATRVTVSDAGAFATKIFELERSTDNEDEAGFTGYVYLYDDVLEGTVTNSFPCDIKDAVIMFYGRMAVIGDLKAGESRDISELELINIPLADSEAVSAYILGLNEPLRGGLPDEEYLAQLRRTGFYAFYRDIYLKGYTADAYVFGEAREGDEKLLMGSDAEGSGRTLLASSVSVDSRDGDKLYRSVLIRDPMVMSGNYTAATNVMYTTEPVVLEYQLGGDIDPETVHFEWPDERIGTGAVSRETDDFKGSMAFYNYNSGSYDYVDMQKTDYTVEELSGYLSPSDTITIKYTCTGDRETAALCMISVEGTER